MIEIAIARGNSAAGGVLAALQAALTPEAKSPIMTFIWDGPIFMPRAEVKNSLHWRKVHCLPTPSWMRGIAAGIGVGEVYGNH